MAEAEERRMGEKEAWLGEGRVLPDAVPPMLAPPPFVSVTQALKVAPVEMLPPPIPPPPHPPAPLLDVMVEEAEPTKTLELAPPPPPEVGEGAEDTVESPPPALLLRVKGEGVLE